MRRFTGTSVIPSPTSSCSVAVPPRRVKAAGRNITVPFTPGRTDARRSKPTRWILCRAGPRRMASSATSEEGQPVAGQYMLLDKANLLALSAPEMTVLVGGLRPRRKLTSAYQRACSPGLESRPTTSSVNLLDMGITWEPSPADEQDLPGQGWQWQVKWTGRVVTVFGFSSELQALVGSIMAPMTRGNSTSCLGQVMVGSTCADSG